MRLQQQARALGNTTRHDIFCYLAEASHEVDVAELTDHVGLHHNAVRQHLSTLVDAGLVTEATASAGGRGRPRLLYSVAPAANDRWLSIGPYEQLALLLSEIIRTGDDPVEVGRRSAANQTPASSTNNANVNDLVADMARRGFNPTIDEQGSHIEIALNACPFASVVATDPATVCGIHLGLARGAAESVPGLVVDDLVRNVPPHRPCRLHCHLE